MKTIIAGSRTLKNMKTLEAAIARSKFQVSEVVSGGARGIDQLGEKWAAIQSLPIKTFEPDWNKFGKSAGMIRNGQMARYADALIAIWDGQSRGTRHMIEQAKKYGLRIYIATPRGNRRGRS